MTRFKKLEKQKSKGLLTDVDRRMKVNKHGHLILKKSCQCGSSNAIMKRNSQDIKCTKCSKFWGNVIKGQTADIVQLDDVGVI